MNEAFNLCLRGPLNKYYTHNWFFLWRESHYCPFTLYRGEWIHSRWLETTLQSIVESNKLVGGTEAKVTIEILRPGYRANQAGYAVAQLANEIQKELNRRPFWIVPMARGATDAGLAPLSGNAAVVECLGLSGDGYHAQDEYIEIDSIAPCLYLITRLLTEFGKN